MSLQRRFVERLRDEQGQGLAEYALILVLIASVANPRPGLHRR